MVIDHLLEPEQSGMDLELGAVDLDELGHNLDVDGVRREVRSVHVVVHEGDGQPLSLRGGAGHQHRAQRQRLYPPQHVRPEVKRASESITKQTTKTNLNSGIFDLQLLTICS